MENVQVITGKGLENWDVSKVRNMPCLFMNCRKFNVDLSNWNTSNVRNLSHAFAKCTKFEGKGLDKWKTTNFAPIIIALSICIGLVMGSFIFGNPKFNVGSQNNSRHKLNRLIDVVENNFVD